MLRRDFIRTGSVFLGGILVAGRFSFAPRANCTLPAAPPGRKAGGIYRLHGDARSGCATPPELASLLEKGITGMPS
jgi:hypothetical protein